MLIANYHTHTPRCFHAKGTEEEYAEAALCGGIRILGFSDHTPQWFPGDYYSNMRMYPNQLPAYCDAVRKVRALYAGRLEVHLGVEAEYYPAIFKELVTQLRDHGVEYMLLGQHWAGNEIGEVYSGRPTEDEAFLRRYTHQVMDAMNTGLFTYIAHPDTLNFAGEDEIYQRYIRPMCREAKSCDIPLEINLLGLRDGRHYPNPKFWEMAAEENCRCVIGVDAHTPDVLADAATYNRALELVKQYGLDLLDTVPLRPIG